VRDGRQQVKCRDECADAQGTFREAVAMRETSSATTRAVLGFLRARGGEEAVAAVLAAADLPDTAAELGDPGHWVSYQSRIKLFEAAVAHLGGDSRIMYEVGRSSLRQNVSPSVTLAMRALGTPKKVFRFLPRNVAKYSTTSTMKLLESGSTHATFSFKLHDGYLHSRLDCLYAQGLIASVTEGFGLPPATIVHDECESDGADACVYRVSWPRFSRFRSRRHQAERILGFENAALRRQLDDLRSAAADLVGGHDLDQVLRRVVERAASAVIARGYLLLVRTDGERPLVHAHGLDVAEIDALTADLLAGRDVRPSAVLVDVASAHRHHGWLLALHGADQEGLPEDREALRGYARHAAAALDMVQALEDRRRDADRARALLELAHGISAARHPETIAEVVAEALPGIVGCDSSGVLLWDEQTRVLRGVAGTGGTAAAQRLMLTSTFDPDELPELAALLADPQPLVLTADMVGPPLSALFVESGVEQAITVPLLSGTRLHGVLVATWRIAPHTGDGGAELMLRLRGIADQSATALGNAQLASAIRHQAEHDELTGLPNRRLFLRRLSQALDGQRRTDGTCVGVLFCDLDGFKTVNDRYGHAVGDELLRQVAKRLRNAVRETDEVGRLSGDELAALLPVIVDLAEAQQVADRILDCFVEPFRIDGAELTVTASIGIATQAGPGGEAGQLLREADQAMYAAKQSGRNQHVCFPDIRASSVGIIGAPMVDPAR
jgi:diguanylate cyclase (GGDEF)-like protein